MAMRRRLWAIVVMAIGCSGISGGVASAMEVGDLVFNDEGRATGVSEGWAFPNHVGVYIGHSANSSAGEAPKVVETVCNFQVGAFWKGCLSEPNSTRFVTLSEFMRRPNRHYGARKSKTPITALQRKVIANYVIGKALLPATYYDANHLNQKGLDGQHWEEPSPNCTTAGCFFDSYDEFDCVGLAERAYEIAGVNADEGIVPYPVDPAPKKSSEQIRTLQEVRDFLWRVEGILVLSYVQGLFEGLFPVFSAKYIGTVWEIKGILEDLHDTGTEFFNLAKSAFLRPDEQFGLMDEAPPLSGAHTGLDAQIALNLNAPETSQTSISLLISADSRSVDGSALWAICLANGDESLPSKWDECRIVDAIEPGNSNRYSYTESRSWTLLPGDGRKFVHIWVIDKAANSKRAKASITLRSTASVQNAVVLKWVQPPPTTLRSGANYTLTWSVSAGANTTHTNIHADTIPDLSPATCAGRPSCISAPTPGASSAPGQFSASFTAPVVSVSTNYYFSIHAVIGGVDYLSGLVSAVVAPGISAPVLSVAPSTLNFGSVAVGASKDLDSIIIRNTGGGAITGSVATSAPFEVLSGRDISIGAGGAQVIDVRYAPSATGAANKDLSIVTSAGKAVVALSGTGTAFQARPPPSAVASSATYISQTLAVMNGSVDAQGSESYAWFEWWRSGGEVYKTGVRNFGAATAQMADSISGLEPGTQYFYRIGAHNESGTTFSSTATFTTASSGPGPTLCLSPSQQMTFSMQSGGASPAAQTLQVNNCGSGSFDWRASTNAAWLTMSSYAGTQSGAPASVNIVVDGSGLTDGSYHGAISVFAGEVEGSPRVIPVHLNVTPAGVTVLASGLAAPRSVLVDAVYAYFDDNGVSYRVPLLGGAADTLGDGRLLAQDASYVYLGRPIAGGQTEGIIRIAKTNLASSQIIVSPQPIARLIAYGADLYWTDNATGGVFKGPISGGSPTYLFGVTGAVGIGTDGISLFVSGFPGSLWKSTLSGGLLQNLLQYINASELDVSGSYIYWAEPSLLRKDYSRITSTGGVTEPLASSLSLQQPDGLAVSALYGGSIYWVDAHDGKLRSAPSSGGAIRDVLSGLGFTKDLAMDSQAFFILSNNELRRVVIPVTNPQAPAVPTGAAQYREDGTTGIPESGGVGQRSVVLKATLSDPQGDNIRLEVDLRDEFSGFLWDALSGHKSGLVPSGAQATVTLAGLTDGQYWWRYRAVDASGNVSPWAEFGAVGKADFIIASTSVWASENWKTADVAVWGGSNYDPSANPVHPSIGIDASGDVHVVYYDPTTLDLRHSKSAGGEWVDEILRSTGDVGRYAAIMVDSVGNPRVSAYDASTQAVVMGDWTGSDWQWQYVGGGPIFSSVLDSQDRPHIAYYRDDAGVKEVRYSKWDGAQWSNPSVVFTGNLEAFPESFKLALDPDDTPHVIYRRGTDFSLRHAVWNGSGWDIELMPEGASARCGDLVVDSGGVVHAVYKAGFGSSGIVKYASKSGGSWSSPETVGNGSIWDYDCASIGLSRGIPYIVYGQGASLAFAKREGGVWTSEVMDGVAGSAWIDSAVDGDGNVKAVAQTRYSADAFLRFAGWGARAAIPTLPSAPGAFLAADIGITSITWRWSPLSVPPSGFKVMASTGGQVSGPLAASRQSWAEVGLATNTAYSRSVSAFNLVGDTESSAASVCTRADAPSNPQVVFVGSRTAQLSWEAATNPAGTEFELLASTAPGFNMSVLASGGSQSSTWISSLLPATTYHLMVRAINCSGVGTPAATAVTTVTAPGPTAWTFSIFDVLGGTLPSSSGFASLVISSIPVGYFPVIISTDPVNYPVALGPGVITAADSGLTGGMIRLPGGTLEVAVFFGTSVYPGDRGGTVALPYPDQDGDGLVDGLSIAVTTGGIRAYGLNGGTWERLPDPLIDVASKTAAVALSTFSAYALMAQDAPWAPSQFQCLALSSDSIRWNWVDNSTDEQGFRVLSASNGVLRDSLPPNSTWWTEVSLASATAYLRRVQVFGPWGEATSPAATCQTFDGPPAAPSGLLGAVLGVSSIAWTWADNAETETGFLLLSSTGGIIAQGLPANATSWVEVGLLPNAVYSRAVVAVNAGGLSSATTAYAVTWASMPIPAQTQPVSASSLTAAWNSDNPAGTLFWVELSTAPFPNSFSGNQSSVTYDLARVWGGLLPNTTYHLRVRAENLVGVPSAYLDLEGRATLSMPVAGAGTISVDGTSISVGWGANGNPDGTLFQSQIATDAAFGVPAALVQSTFVVSQFGGLVPNTTFYSRVWSVNHAGITSAFVAVAATSTKALAPTASSQSTASAAAVAASWGTGGNRLGTLYRLEIATDSVFSNVAGSSVTASTGATIPGLVANTTFFVRVAAIGNDGSQTAPVFLGTVRTSLLPPTTAVVAFGGIGTSSIAVNWESGGNGPETIYSLESSTNPFFSPVDRTSSTLELWSVLGLGGEGVDLNPNTTYFFRVRAESDWNSSGYIELGAVSTLAKAPTATTVVAVTSSSVELAWQSNGNPLLSTMYELSWAFDSGFTSGAGSLQTSTTRYSLTGLNPSTTYHFRTRAMNHAGFFSPFDAAASTRTLPPLPSLTGIPFGAALGVSSISWQWAPASYAAEYGIWLASSPAVKLGSATASAFVARGLSANMPHRVAVGGVNASGSGGLQQSATIFTLAYPPAGLVATAVYATSASLSWSPNANPAGTTAELQLSTDAFSFLSVYTGSATARLQEDILGCTSYYYRVRHLNWDAIPTAFDGPIQFTTLGSTPMAPSALEAASLAGNKVSLGWVASPSEGIARYKLYWDSGTGQVDYGTPMAVLSSTETSYLTGFLTSSTAYRFALRSYNRCGVEERNTWVTASAPSLTSLTGVKAAIKVPQTGKSLQGNRVTVVADVVLGSDSQSRQVRFQFKASTAAVWSDIPPANINHPNPDLAAPWLVHWDVNALSVSASTQFDLRAIATDIQGNVDTAPSAISVTVMPVGATDADIVEGLVGGKVQKQQVVNNTVTSVVKAADEGSSQTTAITLPPGALAASSATLTVVNNPTVVPPNPVGIASLGVVTQVTLTAQTALLNNKTAAVTLAYPDTNGDGLVDGTDVRVDRLVMYSAATIAGPWTRDLASSVDAANKTVTGNTSHFSFFGLFAPAGTIPDAVRVYPNPFMPNSGNADDGVPYNGAALSGITFDNLPAGAKIKIYTILGSLVAEVSSAAGGTLQWDVKNMAGQDVASDGYLVVISAPGAPSAVKKLLIVR